MVNKGNFTSHRRPCVNGFLTSQEEQKEHERQRHRAGNRI